jgi:hypothetical protein
LFSSAADESNRRAAAMLAISRHAASIGGSSETRARVIVGT